MRRFFFLLLALLPVVSSPGAQVRLVPSLREVSPGATFTVTALAEGASGVTSWGHALRFDPAKFELITQAGGAGVFVPDSRALATINQSGIVRTGGYTTGAWPSGQPTLGVFTFRARAGTSGFVSFSAEPRSTSAPYGVVFVSAGISTVPGGEQRETVLIGSPPATGTLAGWVWRRMGVDPASNMAAMTADPDADSLPNLVEYALGLDPLQTDAPTPLGVTTVAGKFQITYRVRLDATQAVVAVQASDSLAAGSWNATGLRVVSSVDQNGFRLVTIEDDTPPGASSRRFYRLLVTSVE